MTKLQLGLLATWLSVGVRELSKAKFDIDLTVDDMESHDGCAHVDFKLPNGHMLSLDITEYDR